MARKAIEILKARGYTDDELTAMQTLLTPKFCTALEAEDLERERIQAEATKYKADLDATTTWYHQEAVPALNKALNDATTARGEAAAVAARLKAMQDYGLARVAENQDDPNKNKPVVKSGEELPSGFDPAKYVSADTFLQTTDRFGEAIAVATDIAEDHRDLFGSRLPGGVTGLRKEYQEAVKSHRFQGDLRAFWENKFNVQVKQTERSQAARQKELDDYANTKIAEKMSEMGNPMTRTLVQSRNPFTAKVGTTGSTAVGEQPWGDGKRTPEQRRSDRVVRFHQKLQEKSA